MIPNIGPSVSFLFVLFILPNINLHEAVFVIVLAHSCHSGTFGVFQYLIILAAVVVPTIIMEKFISDILCICIIFVLSANIHNLGDIGNALPSQLPIHSRTFFQNDWILMQSQIQCNNVPVSLWHFRHKLFSNIPIL